MVLEFFVLRDIVSQNDSRDIEGQRSYERTNTVHGNGDQSVCVCVD